jgi:hypothetical protein
MMVSAEARWFWRDACPPEVREWFHGGPTAPAIPPGAEPSERVDRYLHAKGNTEIGIKVRDAHEGRPGDVEIKGLVAVVSPPDPPAGDAAIPLDQIEIWCKWKAPQVVAADGILTRKRRWMRRYMVVAADVEELPLDGNEETPFTPSVGCNLELTQVDTDGHPVSWWTLGFEAFGDIQSAPDALAATYAFLQANGRFPPLSGERLSYPEWLDRL